jgi:cyclophilin family peptidyl-prolyl cis-trans isomerase
MMSTFVGHALGPDLYDADSPSIRDRESKTGRLASGCCEFCSHIDFDGVHFRFRNRLMKDYSMRSCSWPRVGLLFLVMVCANFVHASTFVRMDYNLYLNTHYQATVFIELFDDKPITKNNFLQYVDAGKYDDSIMHRLSRNFVLQGGGFYQDFIDEPSLNSVSLNPNAKVDLDGNPATNNPTITNEYSVGTVRSNVTGTIAMARVGGQVNSATNQFFFNYKDTNSFLDTVDGGFTVFAKVVGNGMTLLNAYNSGLGIANLNPDADNNGVREAGPFGMSSTDGVPFTGSTILKLEEANRTDYFSSTSSTNVTASNLTFINPLAHVEAGATFTGTGKIVVGSGKVLSTTHGANIGRPLEVSGEFSPGIAVGTVTLNSYTQLAAGKLTIQLGGETVGTQYDQINVTTSAALAGNLSVFAISSFVPSAGDTFNILNAGSITGSFSTATLPTLRNGLAWDLQTTATSMKLVVLPDYNNNGTVDTGDLTVWQDNYGSTTSLAADGDGDGRVTGRDFLLWQRYFGETKTLPPAPTITAIPEPASSILVLLALVAGMSRQTRR